ncbi:MAG: hypothetical protein HYR67_11385 [Bacteroidetes bacterium]|nr:hypothetical protein [Bacteroidota bacterium]
MRLIFIWFVLMNRGLYGQEVTREFYVSGELKATGKIVNGLKEGQWSFYYPSGKKNSIENYKTGSLHGDIFYFYPNETLQAHEQWREGKMQDSAWYFHANGKLHRKGVYQNNQYAEFSFRRWATKIHRLLSRWKRNWNLV